MTRVIGLENIICVVSTLIDANKNVFTLVVEDSDALDKHMDCKMKCGGSCSGGREKEYATFVIVATTSKRGSSKLPYTDCEYYTHTYF